VANSKPSKVDRIPVVYPGSKSQPTHVDPQADFTLILALTPLTPEERAAQTRRALEVLASYDALDLADALGLSGERSRPPAVSASSVPCLTGIGQPCIAAKSGQPWNGYHRGRQRRAQELREAAA